MRLTQKEYKYYGACIMFKTLSTISDKIMYHMFCLGIKAQQYPAVLHQRKPSFLSDDILTRPTSGVYALAVKYSGFSLGDDYIALLGSLQEAGVNTIVVCNGYLNEAKYRILKGYAHRILVRDNVGRDMGAYRAATLYLNDQGLQPDRMLYFNDSVLYVKGASLCDLIGRLISSRYDVVGSFENHQFDHHIGSYVFSISGSVFRDPRFQRFWRRYRPYDLRTHAIKHGEIALSRNLKRSGYGIDVVYSAERLAQRLYELDLVSLLALIQFMRPAFRLQPLDNLVARPLAARRLTRAFTGQDESDSIPQPVMLTIGNYTARLASSHASIRPTEAVDEVTETLARHALIDRLMLEVTQGSQIHLGFGLFHRLLDCPLIKKDLLARDIYLEHDCSMILDRLSEETRAPIMRELVTRGRPLNVQGMRRFLLNHGLI